MSLLQVRGLQASYGAAQALFGVDLDVHEGAVVALMGRNGMGKTTTIKCVCGMLAGQGSVTLAGRDVLAMPSHKIAALGLGLVPEGRRCFRDLTVRENLVAAARPGDWTVSTVTDLLPRLGERLEQRAGTLSGGEQQMLAIGRALMTNPRLLVLDEATEGLAPIIRAEIWSTIARLKRDTGLAILVVDKSIKELKGVCDSAVVLARGRTVWAGDMEALGAEVLDAHVGV